LDLKKLIPDGINLYHLIPILLILIGVQIGAIYLTTPLVASGQTAFGDPQEIQNPFIYLGYVLIATAVMLLLFKWGLQKAVSGFFMITIWAVIYFVLNLIVMQVWGSTNPIADAIAFIIPIIAVILLWKFPEWYVIDTIGFIACMGITALVGVSFGLIPILILLIIFAVYDAISVYKTRHMIALAENVLTSKLPALFIIPKDRTFSYLDSKKWENLDDTKARQTYIIGMGDIVFPSTLVISANVFYQGQKLFGFLTLPAIGAMIGSWVGMVALQWYASKNQRSHAGLPFLNSFTIVGFLAMYAASLLIG
jgi:presenilin-like A22 family membrane protease